MQTVKNIEPSDQFQVGERVLLKHAGVVTSVTGYTWSQSIGGLPEILQYQLSCGVAAPKNAIERWEVTRGTPDGGKAAAGGAQSAAGPMAQGAADKAVGPQEPKVG